MKTKNNEIREDDCIKSLVSTFASVCKREKFWCWKLHAQNGENIQK